jgi:hypothetical protein
VREDQIAADLADAFARLDPAWPHTLISGPCAVRRMAPGAVFVASLRHRAPQPLT